jgi:hypothetical protein
MSLDKNLTGEQIQQVLDVFLYKALEPIVLYTTEFDYQVSYILALVSANRKRKPSSLPRDRSIELLCQYLTVEDRKEKFRLLREARLERSFLHVFAARFLEDCKGYLDTYNRYMVSDPDTRLLIRGDLDYRALNIGCFDRHSLYKIALISKSYLRKFYEYRSNVLDHYLKHSSRQAKAYTSANGKNFDFYDVRQTIQKNILVAIDKYDSNKGALTSYINWWILNAQTCGTSEHEYGIAYTVPQAQRKKIAQHTTGYLNHSVSLDELASTDDDQSKSLHNILGDGFDLEEDVERSQQDKIVQHLVKCCDVRGCARLVLEIGEAFSEKELTLMKRHSEEEGF